jgi:putative SOS response-associated peptidase YedK
MCGRFGYDGPIDEIEKAIGKSLKKTKIQLEIKSNVTIGSKAMVITSEKPDEIQEYIFGFTPIWSQKMMYLFNARSEEIVSKPSFRVAIRKQRCVIPATFFIEGTEADGWKKPYCIKPRKMNVFFFAGIYEHWVNKQTGEVVPTFSIITTEANEVLKWVTHKRSPVLLSPDSAVEYLKIDKHLNEITTMFQIAPNEIMNAFPVDANSCKKGIDDLIGLQAPLDKSYWEIRNAEWNASLPKHEPKLKRGELPPEESMKKTIDIFGKINP